MLKSGELMNPMPRAVLTNRFGGKWMNCRTCNQPIEFNLTESDFIDKQGQRLAATSKTVACPNCDTMNTRFFSWETEFGTYQPSGLFAAVPTTLIDLEELTPEPEDELWQPEVMQAQTVEPTDSKRIGTDDSWIELTWNLAHRFAWLTLYTAEGRPPIWQRTITLPERLADVDIVRHLTHLAHLCYSLYAASADAVDLIPQLLDTLLDFRLFLEQLED